MGEGVGGGVVGDAIRAVAPSGGVIGRPTMGGEKHRFACYVKASNQRHAIAHSYSLRRHTILGSSCQHKDHHDGAHET